MNDRRTVNRLLSEYYDFLKAGMKRVDELTEAMKEKVEKLKKEKAEVGFSIEFYLIFSSSFSFVFLLE